MLKKNILFIFSFIILVNLVNAGPLYDEVSDNLNQLTYQVSDKTCNSFYYPFLVRYLNDFTFEIITDDTNEHFYMVVKENNCRLNLEFVNGENIKADILVEGTYENKDFSYISKTFRGMLMHQKAVKELKL